MQVKRNITVAAMALSLVAGVAMAASSNSNPADTPPCPGYGQMNGKGPHHGSMGQGHHGRQGKGMMGDRQGYGLMGKGQGKGVGCGDCMGQKGKMSRGPGMRQGLAMNPEIRERQNQFMDATKDVRKELHDKQFAYMEAQRNPSLTQGELQKQEEEIYKLRQELQTKRAEMLKTEQ